MEPLRNPWPEDAASTPPQIPDHSRPRSSTAPNTSHPPFLTAAHPFAAAAYEPVHGPDIPFMAAPGPPPPVPSAPIPPRLPYPENYVANLRRARTAPPPIPPHPHARSLAPSVPMDSKPPRPISYPELPVSRPSEPIEPLEPPREDDDAAELAELAAVLALSQAETVRQEKLKQKAISQEEADLAAALEASMAPNSWAASYSSAYAQTSAQGAASTTPAVPEFPEIDYMDDATFARMLAAQAPTPVEGSFPTEPPDRVESSTQPATNGVQSPPRTRAPLPVPVERPPLSDEQLALQFAAEEEVLARQPVDGKPPLDPPDLPSYQDAKLSPPIEKSSPVISLDSPKPSDSSTFSSSSSGLLRPPDTLRSVSSLSSLRSEESDRPAAVNQFVDAELLLGVSIGFVAPSITPELVPMPGSMPNIISLPYGRCPPLHLQAPNWRHLLKLMARLSGTRIEPTVEALAVTRSPQMQLRTVVQFVRSHVASADWRALLWLTIEHPVPASVPGARKYTTGDTSVLPWSYTLSSVPTLLRDSSDTVLSKYYTIPSSDSVPLPTLPISFPNMAMYLQAALEESRKYSSDNSSGVRRLAKMVEVCYPTESPPREEEGERSRVDRLFKKVIGRKDKPKKSKGGNEDTYELVTPFRLDEWGP